MVTYDDKVVINQSQYKKKKRIFQNSRRILYPKESSRNLPMEFLEDNKNFKTNKSNSRNNNSANYPGYIAIYPRVIALITF